MYSLHFALLSVPVCLRVCVYTIIHLLCVSLNEAQLDTMHIDIMYQQI